MKQIHESDDGAGNSGPAAAADAEAVEAARDLR